MRALLLLLALAAPAAALQKNVGGNASEFLTIGAGARALGMGEAFGPVAEGPDAIYWNPAGLAEARALELSYSRSEMRGFFHHDQAAIVIPLKKAGGALGAAYTRVSQDSLPLVTNANVEVGSFAPHADVFALAYARAFDLDEETTGERDYFGEAWSVPHATRSLRQHDDPWRGSLMAGVAVKAVSDTIYQRSSNALAVDGGALFRPAAFESFCLSFAFRNVGQAQKFIVERENLPSEADLGLSWEARSWRSRWLLAAEAAVPYYGMPYAKAGVEYSQTVAGGAAFSLRAGYKTRTVVDLGPMTGLAFGVGARLSRYSFDFGFQPAGALGQDFRFTLGVKW